VAKHAKGLIDTSVLIDIESIESALLPTEVAIAAITLAELAAGPHATRDSGERARRQERLQRTESEVAALPFDGAAARAYGRVFAAVARDGRKPRGGRAVDLFIAATALSVGLPLYTRNPADFASLTDLMEIVPV
jgi:predicted nucleic acid-binding protein